MSNFNTGDKVYTIGYVDRLERENAELKAQVEQLRKYGNLCAVNLSYSTDAFASEYKSLWKKAAAATPAQCLAEVKAQAGRDGFIDGAHLINTVAGTFSADEIESHANEYANQLRQASRVVSYEHTNSF